MGTRSGSVPAGSRWPKAEDLQTSRSPGSHDRAVGRRRVGGNDAKPAAGGIGQVTAAGKQAHFVAVRDDRVENRSVQSTRNHVQRPRCARSAQDTWRGQVIRRAEARGVSEKQGALGPVHLDLAIEKVLSETLAARLAARAHDLGQQQGAAFSHHVLGPAGEP